MFWNFARGLDRERRYIEKDEYFKLERAFSLIIAVMLRLIKERPRIRLHCGQMGCREWRYI
jgi:hypothetical protein